MLDNCKNAAERWGGVSDLIDKWLLARKSLIVGLCNLSVNPGSSEENKASTEVALNFNDRFDDIHKVDDGIEGLIKELEELGETLEDRFALEDNLIESLHKAHENSTA
jgi:regulator of sigma D